MNHGNLKQIYNNKEAYQKYIGGMLEKEQWVNFRLKDTGNGKYTKIPVDPKTGKAASVNDETTWADFDTAFEAIESNGYDGIGFVFSGKDEFTGIDIDDCFDSEGNISRTANDIVKTLSSYTEYSPSCNGLHIIIRGMDPHEYMNKNTKENIEVYDENRFFTFTGNSYLNNWKWIGIRQSELDSVCKKYFKKDDGKKDTSQDRPQEKKASTDSKQQLSDSEMQNRLSKALEDEKFKALWEGDTSGFPSASEADQAFFNKLAFYLACDQGAMEEAGKQSALYREKWERPDYFDRTISKAIENQEEVYQPSSDGESGQSGQSGHSGHSGQSGRSGQSGHDWTNLDSSGQFWTNLDSSGQQEALKFQGNLTAEIENFVRNSTGYFTTQDIDREFDLRLRSDKKRRSEALKELINKEIIHRDRRVTGKYHVQTTELDFIDLDDTEEESFSLSLPCGLDECSTIPPRSIVVLAGSSNAGKTAFMLNVIRENLQSKHRLMYLMSEMSPQEFKQRVKRVNTSEESDTWKKKVKAADTAGNFNAAISQYNKNGITVVDYLEEIEGEYYRIASDIRSIYDSLDQGVAFIALQKRTDQRLGRGGEGTTEKARLYLTMDNLLNMQNDSIVSLKVIKSKAFPGRNPNGMERHFKLVNGSKFEPLTGWFRCDEKQREQYIERYKKEFAFADSNNKATQGQFEQLPC